MMHDLKWSTAEKKIARRAYDEALEAELADIVAEFKSKAAAAATPAEMWAVEDWLHDRRREIGEMFDYRYSRLPLVFAWLIRKGHLDMARLGGLSEDKLDIVRRIVLQT